MIKKTLAIAGISLLALTALAFVIPLLFKKQITALVKRQINKSVNAKVDFHDVSLSLFRHFPRVTISLNDVSIVGKDEFASDTLISINTMDASADVLSVIGGKDIKIYGVFLESPRIHALINKNGKANWDIAKQDSKNVPTDNQPGRAFQLSLRKYKIRNGYLQYRDESTGINTEIMHFDHEGKGDFTQDTFVLSTKTTATGT
ncbi:MAG TPA: AsmA family protein, partial [Chitinophagaceae bacterium]|nr:AsmA family protein [Chitinophagaceae bacterium]